MFFAGLAQSIAIVSMAAVLLRTSDQKFRGRILDGKGANEQY